MIFIDSLTKTYGRQTVVDDVTFTAGAGRVTGFLGPNGAGKSTSMRMMVGLTRPTCGSARVNGRAFSELPNPGREVGVMLDASAQHGGRTGREKENGIAVRTTPSARISPVSGDDGGKESTEPGPHLPQQPPVSRSRPCRSS